MLLSEIVHRQLCERKVFSFRKFCNELARGYNPDKAVVWDCLMTLRDYYRDDISWYQAYPRKKHEDREVYPHSIKQPQEIERALRMGDDEEATKWKIIAVDNGIGRWHIDYPVVYHLTDGC